MPSIPARFYLLYMIGLTLIPLLAVYTPRALAFAPQPQISFTKFRSICPPPSVWTTSGWNCTPQIGRSE